MTRVRHTACSLGVVVSRLQLLFVRYQRPLRAAWLVVMLVLAACQPDSNGGGDAPGGDGY